MWVFSSFLYALLYLTEDFSRGTFLLRLAVFILYTAVWRSHSLLGDMISHSPTLGGMLSSRACRVLLPSSSLSVMLASRKDTPNSRSFTMPIRLPLVLRGVSPFITRQTDRHVVRLHVLEYLWLLIIYAPCFSVWTLWFMITVWKATFINL